MMLLVIELVWSFAVVFFVCELGERASIAFSEMEYMICQFKSYNFPYDMKKMLPIVIALVSTPFEMSAFGSLSCSRETFKKVGQFDKSTIHFGV